MKYLYLLLLFFIACKQQSNHSLIGKWKLLGPENTETNTDIEFSKDQYTIRRVTDNIAETYNYTQEGNKVIGKKVGSSNSDTTIVQIINEDSVIVTTPSGVYSTLVRYKN